MDLVCFFLYIHFSFIKNNMIMYYTFIGHYYNAAFVHLILHYPFHFINTFTPTVSEQYYYFFLVCSIYYLFFMIYPSPYLFDFP